MHFHPLHDDRPRRRAGGRAIGWTAPGLSATAHAGKEMTAPAFATD